MARIADLLRRAEALVGAAAGGPELAGLRADLEREREALESLDAARRATEEKFARIFQACPEGIALVGLEDGVIQDINPAFSRLFGYAAEEVVGRSSFSESLGIWVDPADRDRLMARLKEKRQLPGAEAWFRRKDGTTFLGQGSSVLVEIGGTSCHLTFVRDVTRRERARQLQLETNRRLMLATRSASIGIWEVDLARNRVVWDDRMHELYGLRRNAAPLSSEDWRRHVHPDDLARVLRARELALAGRGNYDLEFRIVGADGAIRFIKADGQVIRDEQGIPSRMIGSNRDITAQKLAEAGLRHEQDFTRALLDNLVEGVVACDERGELVLFNRILQDWHGTGPLRIPREEWPARFGLFLADGVTPMPAGALPLVRAFNGEQVRDAAYVIHPPGRPARHVVAYGTPVYDGWNRKLGAVVVIHDVTDRVRADEAVRKISVAVEQGPVSVVITDLRGDIEYVNPKFTELTGYSADEVLGRNPRVLKSGESGPEEYRGLWATISSGAVWRGEFHNRKKNGELFWEAATIAPIKDAGGTITNYVAIKEDITEFKLAQLAKAESDRRLEQLNAELEDRVRHRTALLENANAELDAFSYSVSHDLRAPLRGIDGFSEALLEECGGQLSEEGRHYLRRVRTGTQRMGQLIDDLLKLSRVSRGALDRQSLDLTAMARAVLEELRQQDPARPLEVLVEEDLAAAGDRGLVRVVLQNLLGNAWKYTCKASAARIEVLRSTAPDGSPAFCVRDNGAGFDMAYAGKLFTAFQRLHGADEFEGSGIGLAIVQRIIHRHGGQVWAQGVVGQGASFFFSLPGADCGNSRFLNIIP